MSTLFWIGGIVALGFIFRLIINEIRVELRKSRRRANWQR